MRPLIEVAFVSFVLLLGVASGVVIALLLSLTKSVESQSDVLARRSPILTYLACHDRRQDEFIVDLADYMLALIDHGAPGGDVDGAGAEVIAHARRELEAARVDLRDATNHEQPNACPPLPDGVVDPAATTPGGGDSGGDSPQGR